MPKLGKLKSVIVVREAKVCALESAVPGVVNPSEL